MENPGAIIMSAAFMVAAHFSGGVTFLASEIPVPLVSHVVILMTHVIVQQSVHHYVVCNVESGLSCVRQGAVVSWGGGPVTTHKGHSYICIHTEHHLKSESPTQSFARNCPYIRSNTANKQEHTCTDSPPLLF